MAKGKPTRKKSRKQSSTLSPKVTEQRPKSQPPQTEAPAKQSGISGTKKSEVSGQPTEAVQPGPRYNVIIDVNIFFYAGRQGAKKEVLRLIAEILLDQKNKESWSSQQGERKKPKGDSIPDAPASDPKAKDFIPEVLGKTVIALPLFRKFAEEPTDEETKTKEQGVYSAKTMFSEQYV